MADDRWYEREFRPYISAAEGRARAEAALARLARRRSADVLSPVRLTGRKIAGTFWGKAWCDNLESYADFAYRLDRGRSYVRRGAVIDLQIDTTRVRAQVVGTRVYRVEVAIRPLERSRWKGLVDTCGNRIDSVVPLLEGRLPDDVLRLVTDRDRGLFPAPRQIAMSCTCPDRADMCKHVAATLYGVGARLDERPELFFLLRGVNHGDLVHAAADRLGSGPARGTAVKLLDEDLGALFGIELASSRSPASGRRPARGAKPGRASGKPSPRPQGRPRVPRTPPPVARVAAGRRPRATPRPFRQD
jgi:hypothetical protein